MKQYTVAILGATGAVGTQMIQCLAEQDFVKNPDQTVNDYTAEVAKKLGGADAAASEAPAAE